MISTVKQAQDLWCPMARVAKIDNGTVSCGQSVCNRLAHDSGNTSVPSSAACIANECAMWRWHQAPILESTATLSIDDACLIMDIDTPMWPATYDNPIPSDAQIDIYSEECHKIMHDAIHHHLVRASFVREPWTMKGDIWYSEDEGRLYAAYSRDADPDATGYCGLAGKPT